MRTSLEPWVRRWWRGEAGAFGTVLDLAAWPAEVVFRAAVQARQRRFDPAAAAKVPIPVVSIGNLTVGGTGKTPLAAWAARVVVEAGGRPGIVSRGYGFDELLLHRRWNPDVSVHAHPDRVRAVGQAAEDGVEIAILDDGFQHRRLRRDLDVVLLSAEQGAGGRRLPRGPWREGLEALARADHAVVTRRTASSEDAGRLADAVRDVNSSLPIASVVLAPERWTTLEGAAADEPAGAVLAVASVAQPESFQRLLALMPQAIWGSQDPAPDGPELWSFPDHHIYTEQDVRRIRERAAGRTVVTTEKDAVKLAPLARHLPDARVLALTLRFEEGEASLVKAITALVCGGGGP